MPPVACNVCVYGTPTIAFGSEPVNVRLGTGFTVIVTWPVVDSVPLSVAWMVICVVPAAVGVPVIVQFAPSIRFAGSAPAVIVQL